MNSFVIRILPKHGIYFSYNLSKKFEKYSRTFFIQYSNTSRTNATTKIRIELNLDEQSQNKICLNFNYHKMRRIMKGLTNMSSGKTNPMIRNISLRIPGYLISWRGTYVCVCVKQSPFCVINLLAFLCARFSALSRRFVAELSGEWQNCVQEMRE